VGGARPAGVNAAVPANGNPTRDKNKKKVHTIKNQSNIKKEAIKIVSN
jgi:hypothetical protein